MQGFDESLAFRNSQPCISQFPTPLRLQHTAPTPL